MQALHPVISPATARDVSTGRRFGYTATAQPIRLPPEAGHANGIAGEQRPPHLHLPSSTDCLEHATMLDLLRDLWGFMRERKKFWLAPIIVVMLLLGTLLVLAQGSAVAPFIYTLF
jgi:hypothetical protein